MTVEIQILYPDGWIEKVQVKPENMDKALTKAVGGMFEYVSSAFHALQTHDVVINENGLGRLPVNRFGSKYIGLNLSCYEPYFGPIVLVPLEVDENNLEAREHESSFFATLEVDPKLLGYDFVIDARIGLEDDE
jgi:hypothetical protein